VTLRTDNLCQVVVTEVVMPLLDSLEKISKIIAALAIPIVLAFIASEYQAAERDKSLALEYVKLSLGILGNTNRVDPNLHDWALDTLNHYSQVKMSAKLEQELKQGTSSISSDSSVDSQWFAVLASPATEQEAIQVASGMAAKAPADLKRYPLELYRTKISKLYAITVGREASRADAFKITRAAKDSGWVPDAFAQKNREWEWVRELKP